MYNKINFVFVDPPADELKKLLMEHGGVYHHYFEKDKTTFMIASSIPVAKMNAMKNFKVVKPEWLVECIKAGKMLNYNEYLLLPHCSYSLFTSKLSSLPLSNMTEDQNSMNNDGLAFPSKEVQSSTHHSHKIVHSTCESNLNMNAKTARDDNFINEFYSNSRLHHLSTMSVKLKAFINELRRENVHVYPGRERLKKCRLSCDDALSGECGIWTNDQKCIMHIDIDCFFASVGIRNNPKLMGLPVAVSHARKDTVMNFPSEGVSSGIRETVAKGDNVCKCTCV